MKAAAALLLLTLSTPAFAAGDDIALNELGFLDAIQSLDKTRIAELFGDPYRAIEVKNTNGDIVGLIWHFQYLNTTETGEYYKVTELDIVGDRVVTVIFSNTDLADTDTVASNTTECPASC